jgi:hypothetical protein
MRHVINNQWKRRRFINVMAPILFIFFSLIIGCGDNNLYRSDFKTEYQGIVLVNGTGYFGKIERMGDNFIELSEVYYVENQRNSGTVQTVLIKRGDEVHAPDRMYINITHIVMIEPVNKGSKIDQSIRMHK